jgi:hypothetical protein
MNPPFHPPSVCPSANLSPFYLPHTETRQWGPHPSSIFPRNSASPGAFIKHWGTRFCILYIFPTFIYYFVVQTPFITNLCFCHHCWRPAFLFGHTQPMLPLVGVFLLTFLCRHRPYLQSMTQVTYRYPLHLFTLSRLWHNLPQILSSP